MSQINHVSFDVWNTLIEANPNFAQARTQMIAELVHVPEELVKIKYTDLKRRADREAERGGTAYSTDALLVMLFDSLMGSADPSASQIFSTMVSHGISELFKEHPPIIRDDVLQLVGQLVDSGISVSIGSNSNFISGSVMYPWLQQVSGHVFSYGIFSDLIGASKPSATFFGHVVDGARGRCGGMPSHPSNILHVGDSQRCDVWGATQLGINALLVANPEATAALTVDVINQMK